MDLRIEFPHEGLNVIQRRIEKSNKGDIIIVSSFFDVCKSIVMVNRLFLMAQSKGVVLRSETEDWLSSESWNERKSLFVQLHQRFISHQSKTGLKKAIKKGKKIGPKFGTRPVTDRKMRLAASIYEVNKEVTVTKICEVLDISLHTFNRLKDQYMIR